jgi:hypothetical protein
MRRMEPSGDGPVIHEQKSGSVLTNVRFLSGLPVQRRIARELLAGSFDRTVCTEPVSFAADAVIYIWDLNVPRRPILEKKRALAAACCSGKRSKWPHRITKGG